MNGSSKPKKTTPSRENYLKVILGLSGENGTRSVDIANALGISKASVSNMMAILMDEGYISKKRHGTITLTESGKHMAVKIKNRYELLKSYLHNVLGVEAATAAKDACSLEHLISPETVDCISRQLKNFRQCGNKAERS